ncbi:MAG: carboxymuconolactone decarboxylase family protein [Rhodospirillales bacterium]|nr:carboxymuconolactone decarboxylase family protein [Rhodospirillales bacterium]
MTLRLKERELVAVGASVAAGCKPCTDYHFKAARKAKLSDDEIRQAINNAMSVRQSALEIMKDYGLQYLGEGVDVPADNGGESTRIRELVAVAAAFAVNCTSNLERHLGAAKTLGITDDEIDEVIKLARFIKGKAASHVEKIVTPEEDIEQIADTSPAAKAVDVPPFEINK